MHSSLQVQTVEMGKNLLSHISYGFPDMLEFWILSFHGGEYLELVFWNLKPCSLMYQTTWYYIPEGQNLN